MRWSCLVASTVVCIWWSEPAAGKAFPGPGGTVNLESRTFGSTEFVPLMQLADALGLAVHWYYEPRRIELRNSKITLDLMASSRCLLVDKQDPRWLTAAPVFVKGEVYVPASLLTATLEPYYRRLAQGRASGGKHARLVVLDAGHGGKDHGAYGDHGIVEKELTLDLVRRIRRRLTSRGVKVLLTRDGDYAVPLVRRADIANDAGATVFVSVHANSVSGGLQRKISGCETFYLSQAQSASAREAERVENSALKYEINSAWGRLTQRVKRFFLGRHFTETRKRSITLAKSVQQHVAHVAVGRNRGIKPANFSVLRNVYCPGCLVEVGFISHPTDATYLNRSSYRDKIADAVADGIMEFLD
jgi:N-acetylmuramoyl-L-alanine amidase